MSQWVRLPPRPRSLDALNDAARRGLMARRVSTKTRPSAKSDSGPMWTATPLAHLGHFSRRGAVNPLTPVDVGLVIALVGEVAHEGMMGR
jgi:hypothetical protein